MPHDSSEELILLSVTTLTLHLISSCGIYGPVAEKLHVEWRWTYVATGAVVGLFGLSIGLVATLYLTVLGPSLFISSIAYAVMHLNNLNNNLS